VSLDADPERTDGKHSPIEDTYWIPFLEPHFNDGRVQGYRLVRGVGSGDGVFSRIGVFSFSSDNPATSSGPHSKGITFADLEAVKAIEKIENTTITLI
jgi:hypothetical protein